MALNVNGRMKEKTMKKVEFTMNQIFTFGYKDAVHRFMIRDHFLKNNHDFKCISIGDNEKCIITIHIQHNKDKIDIDNVPKVIIDSFSNSQIDRDIEDLKTFRKNPTLLSENKQKEYKQIISMNLFDIDKYKNIALYKDDTIKYIQELHCYASIDETLTSPNIKIIIEIK